MTLAVLLGSAGMSWSAEGYVVLNKSGCIRRYVIETDMGYTILELFAGNDPAEGRRMVSYFESYGMRTIYNVSSLSEVKMCC
jgi:hypothetical protein